VTRWGLVATVKAPARAVLDFAAWHLELGAHRLYIHLDAPDPALLARLKAHPRIRATLTGPGYWQKTTGQRPAKHQARQTVNATRVLARTPEVDWLGHIDVDEFLLPDASVAAALAALPEAVLTARMRPAEALAPAPGLAPPDRALKRVTVDRPTRRAQTERLFPAYARGLDGGFLSHVAGKLFVRTTLAGAEFRIHNVFRGPDRNPGHAELPAITLCHMHAADADDWLARYRFRHARGSYRSELKPPRPAEDGGMSLHAMLAAIEAEAGEAGLRAFFDEVCTARPALLDALAAEGLLHRARIDLDAARARHFPD